MKKSLLWFMVVVLVVFIVGGFSLTSCEQEEAAPAEEVAEEAAPAEEVAEEVAPAEEVAEKTTLVVGLSHTPSGIDIDIEGDPECFGLIDAVYDGGTERTYAELELDDGTTILYEDARELSRPYLFESYELDEDTRVITVHLREGVISARGNEFTTKDIEWSLKRNAALQAIGLFVHQLYGVDILTEDMGGFKIIDDYTYQLTQNKTNYPIDRFDLMHANLWAGIWDSTETLKHVSDEDPWASEYIGVNGGSFGPYYITEWTAGEQIVLEANPNYWNGPPAQFTKIIYKVIPESTNRIAALKEGVIDIAAGLSAREHSELIGEPGIRIINVNGASFLMLWANRELNDAFKDPKVMQAINCAIPREDISELAYFGFAKPMESVVSKKVGDGVSSDWPFSYDLDKAKQLLAETDYADGFDVTMHYDGSYPTYETTCLLIAESLAEIGINVDLQSAPSGVYDSQLRNRELEFFVYPTTTWSADPFMPLLQWYGVDHFENYGNWSNPDFDQMVYDGSLITDPAEKAAAIEELGQLLLDDPPVGYVVETQDLRAIRDEIKNWNWLFEFNVKYNWLTWEE